MFFYRLIVLSDYSEMKHLSESLNQSFSMLIQNTDLIRNTLYSVRLNFFGTIFIGGAKIEKKCYKCKFLYIGLNLLLIIEPVV